jgi:hypothetical protein
MVRVYFQGGGEATLREATKVDHAVFSTTTGSGIAGIACTDDKGTVFGRFRSDQIIGYQLGDAIDEPRRRVSSVEGGV